MREKAKRRTLQEQSEIVPTELVGDIRRLVEETRGAMSVAVNAALTMLHWRIGKRISEEILGRERAEYGAEIVSALGRQLEDVVGKGFSPKSLRHMIRF